jgi:hypothetical protein
MADPIYISIYGPGQTEGIFTCINDGGSSSPLHWSLTNSESSSSGAQICEPAMYNRTFCYERDIILTFISFPYEPFSLFMVQFCCDDGIKIQETAGKGRNLSDMQHQKWGLKKAEIMSMGHVIRKRVVMGKDGPGKIFQYWPQISLTANQWPRPGNHHHH